LRQLLDQLLANGFANDAAARALAAMGEAAWAATLGGARLGRDDQAVREHGLRDSLHVVRREVVPSGGERFENRLVELVDAAGGVLDNDRV
jgi:hypothetical protein